MIKLIKNEFIKLLNQKKLLFLIITMLALTILAAAAYRDLRIDILQNTPKGQKIIGENRELISNIDYLNFTNLISKDFLFKPFIPIYLIFLSVIVTSVFSDDLLSGNLKFFLISGVSKGKIILSKIAFIFLLITFIALTNFIINLLVGYAAFGGPERSFANVMSVFKIYSLSIPAAGAFSVIVLMLSSLIRNSTATIILCIVLSILLNVIDLFTKSKYVSPIGIMALLSGDTVGSIPAIQIIVPFIYVILVSGALIASFKRSDVVY